MRGERAVKQRLQKLIAHSGYCSRRTAEKLIEEGRVRVGGIVASLGDLADEDTDLITIDDVPLPEAGRRTYIMLNKPRGYVTTMSDEKGRRTVRDLIEETVSARVYPVGRLDINSEGLLIMTDDGELTYKLTHPSCEVAKTYELRVSGSDIEEAAELLRSPLFIDGVRIRPAKVEILKCEGESALLRMTIREGRNRQIRKMCDQAGLRVLRLKRIAKGGLKLGKLPAGKWRYLSQEEIENLQK